MKQIYIYFNSEIWQDQLILFIFSILVLNLVAIYLNLSVKQTKTLIDIGIKVWITVITGAVSHTIKTMVDKQLSENKTDNKDKVQDKINQFNKTENKTSNNTK